MKRGDYRRDPKSGKLIHRVRMEKKLGRSLSKQEVVHHIDKNNHPDNLMLFPNQFFHNLFHQSEAKLFGKGYSFQGKKGMRYYVGMMILILATMLLFRNMMSPNQTSK